jgi:sialate O-acetylesterase
VVHDGGPEDRKISMISRALVSFILVALAAVPATADVRLPKIFTDNMMVQRDRPVRVWGWAEPGEQVEVTLDGKAAATKADDKGRWQVELPAIKEGENLELAVAGRNRIVLKNVIVGDIWRGHCPCATRPPTSRRPISRRSGASSSTT